MPEVRDVLDRHLDLSRDPALATRSVYGQWYPWLVTFDKDWAASAADRIFPLAMEFALQFEASWYAYVSFNQAYNDAARLLEKQYRAAVDRLGDPSPVRIRALRSLGVALAVHDGDGEAADYDYYAVGNGNVLTVDGVVVGGSQLANPGQVR
jgi:hypothetical protein